MRRYSKLLALLCIAMLTLSLLAGCGGNKASGTDQKATEQTKAASKDPVTIKIWHRTSSTENGPAKAVEKFNASQKDVKAEIELYGDNYGNTLKLAIAGGSAADIYELGASVSAPTVKQAAEAGYIVDMEDIVKDLKPKLDPGALNVDDFYYKGKIYTVPVLKMFYQLLYNKTLFTKAGLDPKNPPKTFEQVREYAKKITDAGKGDFYGFGLPLGASNIWYRTIDMMEAATGKGLYGYNYDTGKFDFSNHKKYLDIFLGLKKDGSIYPGEISMDIEQMRAKFAEGKVGMYFDGNWILGAYNVTLMMKDDFDMANIPVLEGQKFNQGYAYYSQTFGINSQSKNIDAAKKYFKFWLENTDVYLEALAQGPTSFKLTKEVNPKVNKEQFKTVLANESKYLPFYLEPHTQIPLVGDNRDKAMIAEFIKAYDGKGDFDKVIADLNTRYNDALQKAITDGTLKKADIKK